MQGRSWFSSAKSTAENEKARAASLADRAAAEIEEAKSKANKFQNDVAASIDDAKDQVETKSKSWLSMLSSKKDQVVESARENAGDLKEETKARLLAAERKVEEEAKKAQKKTEKL